MFLMVFFNSRDSLLGVHGMLARFSDSVYVACSESPAIREATWNCMELVHQRGKRGQRTMVWVWAEPGGTSNRCDERAETQVERRSTVFDSQDCAVVATICVNVLGVGSLDSSYITSDI